MRRYLVVGSETLQSDRLLRELRARLRERPSSFHLLVPAVRPHVEAYWSEGEARSVAQQRLEAAIERLARDGIAVSGSVGDADPLAAVAELVGREQFDAVIVSTLPPGLSSPIDPALPRRIELRLRLPVCHVITPFADIKREERRRINNGRVDLQR